MIDYAAPMGNIDKMKAEMRKIEQHLTLLREIIHIAQMPGDTTESKNRVFMQLYHLIRSARFARHPTPEIKACLLTICDHIIDKFQTPCPGLYHWSKVRSIIDAERWGEITLDMNR